MNLAAESTAADATVMVTPPPAAAATGRVTTNRLRASIVDLTFLIWAVAAPVAFAQRLLNSDGDLARHLAMGEWALRNGLIERDLFSFTKAGETFIAYEWLSQIAYALMHRFGGVAGVAIGAGIIIGTAYALIVHFMLRRGVDPLLSYGAGICAALLGAVHWLARPHLFTFVTVALLLFLLEPRGRRSVWWFAPLFLVWANLHPGFVVGFMLLGVFLTGELAEAFLGDQERRSEWLGRARFHAAGIAIGLGASLLNPRGIHLHMHIRSLLNNSYLIDVTSEFMSPSFHAVHGKIFLVALIGIIAAVALRRERLAFPHLFLLLFTLASALFAQRNIPLFGLVTLPMLAIAFDGEWRRLSVRGLNHVRRVFQEGEALGKPGLWYGPFAALMLLLAWNQGRVGGVEAVTNSFDSKVFPVDAVAWARAADLHGRMYHELTWGGYILYAWPGQKIFIDGLTDFFGEKLVQDYLKILIMDPEWDRELEKYDISLAMLPARGGLAYALQRDGWRKLYGDSTAVILRRAGAAGE